jgi:hypothetical protein
LSTISELHARGANVLDDGVLGYQLVRNDIYRFRGQVPDLEARIAQEHQKPLSDQGPRTAARDGRRTLQLLGFIDSQGAVTDVGNLLLDYRQGTPEELSLWRQAVIAMRVNADGNVSHPMRILLRLLADRGPLARGELALALEATNDGEVEYERIRALVPIQEARERGDALVVRSQRDIEHAKALDQMNPADPEYQRLFPIRQALDRGAMVVTQSSLANSVKILPALALQLNLAVDYGDDRLAISAEGEALYRADFQFGEIGPPQHPVDRAPGRPRRRRAASNPRKIVPGQPPTRFDPDAFAARSPEEQIETVRLRLERTNRHQEVVYSVARAFAARFEVLEDPDSFDALLIPPERALNNYLLEIKTLDLDEVDQTNRGVAQLFWYRWAKLPPAVDEENVLLGIVYDRNPQEETCDYLQSLGIAAFSCSQGVIGACNDVARALCPEPLRIPDL